jgi:hypothetical protein
VHQEEKNLQNELESLKKEHQELDRQLDLLDQMTLQRIKKRKLWLKDRIATLEAIIYPDIIA